VKITRTVVPAASAVTNSILKIKRGVLINGVVASPGQLVEVSTCEAFEFAQRQLVEDATQDEVDAATTILASGTIDLMAPGVKMKLIPGEVWGR